MTIAIAETDDQINACWEVMRDLRPHLNANEFLRLVKQMQPEGYKLAALTIDGDVKAVSGFRIKSTLYCERFLYVDDLVTTSKERSRGYGKTFLDWLTAHARDNGCTQVRLDSGTNRKGAHRFYLSNGFEIASFHFQLDLPA